MRLYSSLGLLAPLSLGVKGDSDGPPDFSSYQYPGQPKERAFKPSYDFCVVGGGAAGLAVGNRLSESGKHTVVVFEAGAPPTVVENYSPPGGNRYGLNGYYSEIDYKFYSAPQPTLKNRTLNYQRGRCLGGSGVTNGLFYGLGSRAIYDAWEAEGNPGWGWRDIQASAKRGTKFVGNPNHTNDNTYMTWDPDAYGTEGPLKIAFQGQVPTSNPSFMNAVSAIGIHPTLEQNSGNPLGVKQGTMTLDENFLRSTSFHSYYKQALGRPNFQVLDRAIVSNVIFDANSCKNGSTPQAIGVTFLDQPSGIIHNVSCRNEVILSGGAFHSPFILKQSGIGPKGELEAFGITPIVVNENVGSCNKQYKADKLYMVDSTNASAVGANMQDHTAISIVHEIKPEFAHIASTEDMTYDFNIINKEQRDFWAGGSKRWNSKISATGGDTNAFKRMSDAELESIGAGELVKLNLTGQAHNEFSYNSLWYPQVFSQYGKAQPGKAYISIFVSNMVAQSKGTVKLGSNAPFTAPVLDNNYLADVVDQRMAVHGLREIRKIMAYPDLAQWSAGEVSPGMNITSYEDLLDYARTTVIPNWHASSTCRMLPREKGGVVDSHLRVYGTKGLRVIDVSTFGRLPDINLIGSVYAVAENGARIIREEYGDV